MTAVQAAAAIVTSSSLTHRLLMLAPSHLCRSNVYIRCQDTPTWPTVNNWRPLIRKQGRDLRRLPLVDGVAMLRSILHRPGIVHDWTESTQQMLSICSNRSPSP